MFREALPDGCPESMGSKINAPQVVYRIIETDPPTDHDFKSHRALNPYAIYRSLPECQVSGLSVTDSLQDARILRQERSARMDVEMLILRIELDTGAGYFARKPSRKWKSHCVWWPYADFNVLSSGTVVQ